MSDQESFQSSSEFLIKVWGWRKYKAKKYASAPVKEYTEYTTVMLPSIAKIIDEAIQSEAHLHKVECFLVIMENRSVRYVLQWEFEMK